MYVVMCRVKIVMAFKFVQVLDVKIIFVKIVAWRQKFVMIALTF